MRVEFECHVPGERISDLKGVAEAMFSQDRDHLLTVVFEDNRPDKTLNVSGVTVTCVEESEA